MTENKSLYNIRITAKEKAMIKSLREQFGLNVSGQFKLFLEEKYYRLKHNIPVEAIKTVDNDLMMVFSMENGNKLINVIKDE